jgi:hypothetical protein
LTGNQFYGERAMEVIHNRLAFTIVLYVFILSLWGFWRFIRKQGVDSSFRGALAIVQALTLFQGVWGIVLRVGGAVPTRGWTHVLYGVVVAISLPAVYVFTKGREERRDILIYAAVLLFMVGISLRAISTGG